MLPRRHEGSILTGYPARTAQAQGWVVFKGIGAAPALLESFNVDGLTDNNPGDYTVLWTRDFPVASQYACGGMVQLTGSAPLYLQLKQNETLAVGSTRVTVRDRLTATQDPEWACVVAVGWSA